MNLTKPNTPIPCPKGSKAFQPTGTGKVWISWTTPGAEWRRVLEIVKRVPNRRWNPDLKLWEAPDTAEIRGHLLHHGFQLLGAPTGPTAIGMPGIPGKKELAPWVPPWKDVGIPGDWSHLRPYQVEGMQMLRHRGGRGLLAMEPGLGKTATSLSYVRMEAECGEASRVVVLATASTKHQWRNEAKKWQVPLPVWILQGRTPHALPTKGIAVLNWEILPPDARTMGGGAPGWLDALVAWNPDIVICDEFHLHTGDYSSNRSKALVKLAKGRKFIPMSGSPMRTRTAQLFTVLHLLDPETFQNQFRFQTRYCGPRPGFGGRIVYDGASHVEELHGYFRKLGIRYTKEQVLKDLPERIFNPVVMDCNVSDEYREAQERIMSLQGVSIGELNERLKALTASAFTEKQDAILEWLTEFLESGKKLVLFCWHVAVADFLEAHLGKQCVRANKKDREAVVTRFVKDPTCKVVLGNISALGTGVDGLQEVCSDVAFAECCWSPSDMDQASSRLHRSGQKGCVTVHMLIAPGTVDEVQLEALDTRGDSMSTIVDGKPMADEERVLAILRKKYAK